ncbi:hypothetical protein COF68_06130 [Bacillus toyonensis]|uniref:hypothetical protein n=1 Tax=Bacillus toyonensis TaxID=155322 RepID=UPI000BFD91C1|nr:hypothetical protein [Bacillus toyonensis]PHE64412.1 hypothetical protein COF68_06130 [Bacillus toyonensis]
MSKEAKQSIYNEYKEIWTRNPPAKAVGFSKSKQCIGLATNPKELVPVLNDKRCAGVVILLNPVEYQEYDVETGTQVSNNAFDKGKGIPFGYYAEVMLEEGIDFEQSKAISTYTKKLSNNTKFVKMMLGYGLSRGLDAEMQIYPSAMDEDLKIFTMFMTRGNVTFLVTTETMAVKVGSDKYIVIHEPNLDVEFDFIVDVLARGLMVEPSGITTILESM